MDPNKYIGLEWESGGRGPEKFDCWGLVLHILKNEYGVLINEKEYNIDAYDTKSVSRAYEHAINCHNWQKVETPRDGDVVALSKNKRIHHAGIYVQNGCLHAMDHNNVIFNPINRLKFDGWNRIEFYRWQP